MIFLSFYLCAAGSYVLLAVWCLLALRERPIDPKAICPAITLLKPIHGLEPGLRENLQSFCRQDYPVYQVVFGLTDGDDPALAVVRAVIADMPEVDIALTINPRAIGSNRKISNVANCELLAKHALLVVADSDMRVPPSYLRRVASVFSDPQVGAGTCLYRGTSSGGLASALGAAFINEWFLPSVLVALKFQKLHFCFGATMAVTRDALRSIGGFQRLANELADDYLLGDLVTKLGKRVALIPCLVENVVNETSLGSLLRHELRWARTVRTVQPFGYSLSFITYVMPAALVFAADEANSALAAAAVCGAIGLRTLMHAVARRVVGDSGRAHYGLVVWRDLLCFGVWALSFFSRNVEWQGYVFRVDKQGQMALKGKT